MPLLDHFHPPLSDTRHWGSFHARWAAAIADELNERLLPAGYYADLHNDLIQFMDADARHLISDEPLYAVSYRPALRNDKPEIDLWHQPLSVGQSLPTIPLFIGKGGTLPLDLELTYSDARRRRRMP